MADRSRCSPTSVNLFLFFTLFYLSSAEVLIPEHYQSEWYAYVGGRGENVVMNPTEYRVVFDNADSSASSDKFTATIQSYERILNGSNAMYFDSKMFFKRNDKECYFCVQVLFRTKNILQTRSTQCISQKTFESVCGQIQEKASLITYFKTTPVKVDCFSTFDGIYHFQYKQRQGGGGFCNTDNSRIDSCQQPGSPYVDNEVFEMYYGFCPSVTSSANVRGLARYQCMGTWSDPITGNIYSGVANMTAHTNEDKFRCLLTNLDQQRKDLEKYFTMSIKPQCTNLLGANQGPIELILNPIINGTQLQEISPACNLPSNFTGTWFTSDEYDSQVKINSTHIYIKTQLDEFHYRETYFTCQQTRETRYLLAAVTVGKCEIDYICADFLPRHHNVIRFRMSKPYQLSAGERADPNYRTNKFLEACSWQSFNFNAAEWKYRTFILDPPNPIACPIQGMYSFTQKGLPSERYYTRIRGITERPRMAVNCRQYESLISVCQRDSSQILVDFEWCATVDHIGRPIGEYDEPDNILTCVGYWMEDSRSYLITFDPEDSQSKFRCWVYERLDFQNYVLSKSSRSSCFLQQKPRSYTAAEGASLAMEWIEHERLFDNCPMYYNNGLHPYTMDSRIEYFSAAVRTVDLSIIVLLIASFLTCLFR